MVNIFVNPAAEKKRCPVHIILTSRDFGVRSSYFQVFFVQMLKRSKMHSFLLIFKTGTPPLSYPKVGKCSFSLLILILHKELINSLYKYQQRKKSSYHLRIRKGVGTHFQNQEERLHFWTFQHMNKKLWKYELLTPKTLEVRMI